MVGQIASALAAAARIFTPGPGCKLAIIQNNGATNVRLSLDGGTDMPNNTGTLPTALLGFRLAAGSQLFLNYAQFPSISGRTIWGISEGGAVVLDIVTDDKDSKAS